MKLILRGKPRVRQGTKHEVTGLISNIYRRVYLLDGKMKKELLQRSSKKTKIETLQGFRVRLNDYAVATIL